jgi:Protein of unknown function (DUF2946)
MIGWLREEVNGLMRPRLRKFPPIVLLALTVQILAPSAACWAASIAAADPLQAAVICHDDGASGPTDQTGQPRAHDGACSMCCVAHTGAPLDTPQTSAVTAPYLESSRVVWLDHALDLFGARAGSQAQARAPPSIS